MALGTRMNKDWNQVCEPAGIGTPTKPMFSRKPLGSEIWFRSLLSKVFHLVKQTYFCAVYDYVGKEGFSKGWLLKSKKKIWR